MFFCLGQVYGGVHPTGACVAGEQGAEQRPLTDCAGATHIAKQDLVITMQRLLDKERMKRCSVLSKETAKRDTIIMYRAFELQTKVG